MSAFTRRVVVATINARSTTSGARLRFLARARRVLCHQTGCPDQCETRLNQNEGHDQHAELSAGSERSNDGIHVKFSLARESERVGEFSLLTCVNVPSMRTRNVILVLKNEALCYRLVSSLRLSNVCWSLGTSKVTGSRNWGSVDDDVTKFTQCDPLVSTAGWDKRDLSSRNLMSNRAPISPNRAPINSHRMQGLDGSTAKMRKDSVLLELRTSGNHESLGSTSSFTEDSIDGFTVILTLTKVVNSLAFPRSRYEMVIATSKGPRRYFVVTLPFTLRPARAANSVWVFRSSSVQVQGIGMLLMIASTFPWFSSRKLKGTRSSCSTSPRSISAGSTRSPIGRLDWELKTL